MSDIDWQGWAETLWTHGARIALIIISLYIAIRIVRRILRPMFSRMTAAQAGPEEHPGETEKRIDTLVRASDTTITTIAVIIGMLMVLPELGVNTTGLLAATGIAGIAIGIGAQSLVRDILSGLFILLENQYGRGDVVTLAGVGGLVEDVNLRRTLLRDLDGALHSVPNGQIAVASNRTRSWARVNTTVNVAYASDLDRVCDVINGVGDELASDPSWQADVRTPPRALGAESMTDTHIEIRVLGETRSSRQWDVARELRRRIKLAFEREGIQLGA